MFGDPFKVLFYIRRAKLNSRGMAPLQCRITYNKKRCEFSTSIFVHPDDWDAKSQLVVSKSNKIRSINNQLQMICQLFLQHFNTLVSTNKPFDVFDVYELYKGEPVQKVMYILEYTYSYLEKYKTLIDIDIKKATWKKYENAYMNLSEFLKVKKKVSDFKMSEVDLMFIRDFELYLKVDKGLSQATINKILQRLKKVVITAFEYKLIEVNPFSEYRFVLYKKPIVYLTNEELIRMEEVILKRTNLAMIRDMFVFCCYTGLAYNEMRSLCHHDIINGFDGNDWIQLIREKTNKPVNIPLLPKAKAIIDKFKGESIYVLPRISNQKFNSYIKDVAIEAGVSKNVTHHTARKTFASTILLYNEVPIEIVSELLGHSSIKVTQESYAHLCNRKVSETMKRLSLILK